MNSPLFLKHQSQLDVLSIRPSTTHIQDQLAVRVHSPDKPHPRAGFACSQDLHRPVVYALRGLGSRTVQILVCPRFAVEKQTVLSVVERPSCSVLSTVSTSPLEWRSIRKLRLRGCGSAAKVERPGLNFHTPTASPPQTTPPASTSKRMNRMWKQCTERRQKPSKSGL